jgi:hypothetical protein
MNKGNMTCTLSLMLSPACKCRDTVLLCLPHRAERMAVLDGEVLPAADFHAEVVWFWPGERRKSEEASIEKPHSHPFDEMVSFIGSDPSRYT